MPDRVDPPVDPVQPSGADAPRDTTLCQTSAGQLPKPDYSMLCRGNLRHKRVGPGALQSHGDWKAPRRPASPPA